MRVRSKILKRVGVLALLICAFAFVERDVGASLKPVAAAFGECEDACANVKNVCEYDAQAYYQSCMQIAWLGYSSCTYSAGQSQQSCQYSCIYDWYWSGGTGNIWSCYDACDDAYNSELEGCAQTASSEQSNCGSEQSSAIQGCADGYQYCLKHCPPS